MRHQRLDTDTSLADAEALKHRIPSDYESHSLPAFFSCCLRLFCLIIPLSAPFPCAVSSTTLRPRRKSLDISVLHSLYAREPEVGKPPWTPPQAAQSTLEGR